MIRGRINSNYIIICNFKSLKRVIDSGWLPRSVLITACNKNSEVIDIDKIIIKLLKNGTKYFSCIGDSSEELHDEIDDIIYFHDYKNNTNYYRNVITTYHSEEEVDETTSYFFLGTYSNLSKNECFLVITGEADFDGKLRSNIINQLQQIEDS